MKKIIAVILILCILIFSSCNFDNLGNILSSYDNSYPIVVSSDEEENLLANASSDAFISRDISPEIGRTNFLNLTQDQKTVYAIIHEEIQQMNSEEIRVPDTITDNELQDAFNAYVDDYPESFWLRRSFNILTRNNKKYIQLEYCCEDLDQKNLYLDLFNSSLAEAKSLINNMQSEYEAELILHDWLLSKCEYDNEAANLGYDSNESAYSAYGALVESKAVCEGYARAMQLLLNNIGIETTLISGVAGEDKQPHMWNIVTINENKYHLDPTWDDIDDKQDVSHIYFNVSSDVISRTHDEFIWVDCSSMEENFYKKNNLLFDNWDNNASLTVKNIISDCAVNQTEKIEIAFSNKEAFDKAVNSLINENSIFDYIDYAKISNKALQDEIEYVTIEQPLYVLEIILKFN